MKQYPRRIIVLLIDFDLDEDRLGYARRQIPENLTDRVFVLGVLSEPEYLKRKTQKTFEQIGNALAEGCPDNQSALWEDDLLKHNQTELDRIIGSSHFREGKFFEAVGEFRG